MVAQIKKFQQTKCKTILILVEGVSGGGEDIVQVCACVGGGP